MPIQLRLRENLEEAIAAYKHYDLLMVNAMFDGMNLIAKEGPLVNERHGVSLLSENTGAHEELAEFALSVNPFDVQEQADAIHRALTMNANERSWRSEGLKRVVTSRDPGDWVDDQLADIEAKRRRQSTRGLARVGRELAGAGRAPAAVPFPRRWRRTDDGRRGSRWCWRRTGRRARLTPASRARRRAPAVARAAERRGAAAAGPRQRSPAGSAGGRGRSPGSPLRSTGRRRAERPTVRRFPSAPSAGGRALRSAAAGPCELKAGVKGDSPRPYAQAPGSAGCAAIDVR